MEEDSRDNRDWLESCSAVQCSESGRYSTRVRAGVGNEISFWDLLGKCGWRKQTGHPLYTHPPNCWPVLRNDGTTYDITAKCLTYFDINRSFFRDRMNIYWHTSEHLVQSSLLITVIRVNSESVSVRLWLRRNAVWVHIHLNRLHCSIYATFEKNECWLDVRCGGLRESREFQVCCENFISYRTGSIWRFKKTTRWHHQFFSTESLNYKKCPTSDHNTGGMFCDVL